MHLPSMTLQAYLVDWKKEEEEESLLRVLPAHTGIRRQRGEDVRASFHFVIALCVFLLCECCVLIFNG